METSLDPQAKNLAIAIRQTESGGNFQAKGKSGEYGAYQFTEPTWNTYAKKYGVNASLKDATPEQQNEVAYKQIKEWKDQGLNVGQIASMWNSGKPDAYLDSSYKGTNKSGASYDVPAYAKSVATAYQTLKSGGQVQADPNNPSSVPSPNAYNPKPFSQPSEGVSPFTVNTSGDTQTTEQSEGEQTLGQKLMKRGEDISGAFQNVKDRKIGNMSGAIQELGGVAGGVNDIVQSGLELIPGVKQAEGFVGGLVGKLANTGAGKKVVGGINNFSQAHPELSADIGAVGNIVGALGTFEGAGAIKDLAGKALGKTATSAAEKELAEVATRTVGGRAILQDSPDVIKVLSQPEFKPATEIVGGVERYATKDSEMALNKAIGEVDEKELQPLLNENNTPQISQRMPLASYREAAITSAKDALMDEGPVEKIFDRIQAKYGDYPTLGEMNQAKRKIAKQISESAFGSDSYTANKIVRNSLQKGVEDGANTLGIGDVNAINKKMANLYKAQDALGALNGKPVKLSSFSKIKKGIIPTLIKGAEAAVGFKGASELYNKFNGQ